MLKSRYITQLQKLINNSFDPMMRYHIYYFSKKKANCIQWSCSPASSFWMGEAAELDVSQAKTILYFFWTVLQFSDLTVKINNLILIEKTQIQIRWPENFSQFSMFCCWFASKWHIFSGYCIWICVRHNCTLF